MTWKNKVIGGETVDPEDVLAHPLNAHRHPGHQRNALRASLDAIGIAAPILINQNTGKLLDGHQRVEEYITKGVKKVPVTYLDLTEDEEHLFLATYDPIGFLGEYDSEILEMLKEEIVIEDQNLNDLIDSLDAKQIDIADQNESPEVKENLSGMYGIMVKCKNEPEQLELLERLLHEGLDVRAFNAN